MIHALPARPIYLRACLPANPPYNPPVPRPYLYLLSASLQSTAFPLALALVLAWLSTPTQNTLRHF